MRYEGNVKAKRDFSGTSRSRGRTGGLGWRWMTRWGGGASFPCMRAAYYLIFAILREVYLALRLSTSPHEPSPTAPSHSPLSLP
jgi:hypothetical protein